MSLRTPGFCFALLAAALAVVGVRHVDISLHASGEAQRTKRKDDVEGNSSIGSEELIGIQAEEEAMSAHISTNSNEMSYEDALALNVTSVAWTNLTDPCYKKVKRHRWLGTAPACAPTDEHCKVYSPDATVGLRCKTCHGAHCWTGQKIRCDWEEDNGLTDECNPVCSSHTTKHWVGTAPSCGANPCHCWDAGMIMLLSSGSQRDACPCSNQAKCAHFGKTCLTGRKVLCAKPRLNWSANLSSAMRTTDCTKRVEVEAKLKAEIAKNVVSLATAGIGAGR